MDWFNILLTGFSVGVLLCFIILARSLAKDRNENNRKELEALRSLTKRVIRWFRKSLKELYKVLDSDTLQ